MRDQRNLQKRQGVLESAERLLQRTLERPRSREAIRAILRRLDPENARPLLRTALWTEPELFFSLAGSIPPAVNALIYAADEALEQLEQKLSPEMRGQFIKSLIDDVDIQTLKLVILRFKRLRGELSPLFDELLEAVRDDQSPSREGGEG